MIKNNFILVGFDRSGTSAISKILAKHPDIELVYRPFNSGPIRKKMYQILDAYNTDENDRLFFTDLENNSFYSNYINSGWHQKYSTIADTFVDGKTHVLITNLNHFSVKWVNDNYPAVEQWGIWRDPIEILNSCVKNSFFNEWYKDAIEITKQTVLKTPLLNKYFGSFVNNITFENETFKTAFLIATRNFFLFYHLDKSKIIKYEEFKSNPNQTLNLILKYFKINTNFDFNPFLDVDLNTIPSADGYKRNKDRKFVLSKEDLEKASNLFKPLYEIIQNK